MSALGSTPNPWRSRANNGAPWCFTALAAIAAILWLVWPVGTGVLMGMLMAFIFRPTYERLARHWPAPSAALTTVVGSTVTIAVTFGALVWIVVRDGTILGAQVANSLGSGGEGRKLAQAVAAVTSRVGLSTEDLEREDSHASIGDASAGAARTLAEAFASSTAGAVLSLFFVMLTMYFVLRRWEALIAAAQDTLPLRPDYTLKLLTEFHRVGRTTLLSTVFIGLVEGAAPRQSATLSPGSRSRCSSAHSRRLCRSCPGWGR